MMKTEGPKGNEKSIATETGNGHSGGATTHRATTHRTAAEIQTWLVSYLATELDIDPKEMDVKTSFDSYGLSSASAVFMTSDLSEWLGSDVDPTLPYDYPNIEKLAQRLAEPQGVSAGL